MAYWDRILTTRVTRRRILRGAGVAGAAAGAIWIAGCSDGKTPVDGITPLAGTPSAGDPTKPDYANPLDPPIAGGRYQAVAPAPFDSFDPHRAVGASTAVFPRIYNVLVQQSAQRPQVSVFDLAESLENPDDVTWIFKIRPGVRIGPNDLGVPERDLDGDDAVATFERIKAIPEAPNGAFVKEFLAGVTAGGGAMTLTTTKPYAWLLSRVGNFVNTIPPRELIADEASIAKLLDRSAGAGPYRLASSSEGEAARLERNPSFYAKDSAGTQLPYLEGIDIRTITDRSAWRTAFVNGQVHQYTAEGKAEIDALSSDFFVVKDPLAQFVPVAMNPEKPPFNDPRARRAVSRAINRQQFVDRIYSGDAKPNGLVHWPAGEDSYAFSAQELEELQPFDVAEARSLVEALGGLKVKLVYPAATNVALHSSHVPIFVEQLKAANIDIDDSPLEFTAWLATYRSRDYEMSLGLTQVIETPEQPLNWHTSNGPLGDRSFGVGIGDPDIDKAIENTKTILDVDARVKAVRDAQKLIYAKDPTFLPLVSGYNYNAYSNKVHNLPAGIGATALFVHSVWIEA
ncbi:MAG: ABC transporter substrate-binding protein [Chloroflexi bacterium]|nr:ABC transporter substrate-binding protein [Chloroflexota bacterium]